MHVTSVFTEFLTFAHLFIVLADKLVAPPNSNDQADNNSASIALWGFSTPAPIDHDYTECCVKVRLCSCSYRLSIYWSLEPISFINIWRCVVILLFISGQCYVSFLRQPKKSLKVSAWSSCKDIFIIKLRADIFFFTCAWFSRQGQGIQTKIMSLNTRQGKVWNSYLEPDHHSVARWLI